MITESHLQYDTSIEWPKFLQVKFPTPFSTFQCYLENAASIIACFDFYSLPFLIQILLHSSWDCIAYKLIKYNQFQVSENKPDETPYVTL